MSAHTSSGGVVDDELDEVEIPVIGGYNELIKASEPVAEPVSGPVVEPDVEPVAESTKRVKKGKKGKKASYFSDTLPSSPKLEPNFGIQ